MKLHFEALRRAGLDVRLLYRDSSSGSDDPSAYESPIGVEIHGRGDGQERKRLRKAVKEAFPIAPATFVDDAVDDLCDELVAHSIARICLEAERKELDELDEPKLPAGAVRKDDHLL